MPSCVTTLRNSAKSSAATVNIFQSHLLAHKITKGSTEMARKNGRFVQHYIKGGGGGGGGGANEKLATQLSLHLKASYPDNQGKRD